MINLNDKKNIIEYIISKSKEYSANDVLEYIYKLDKNEVYEINDTNEYETFEEYFNFLNNTYNNLGPIFNDKDLDINEIISYNNKYNSDSKIFKLIINLKKSQYKNYNIDDCKKIQQIIYNE